MAYQAWHVATNVGVAVRRSDLPRDAPRGRRSISKALKIPRQALRDAPRGRRAISLALNMPWRAPGACKTLPFDPLNGTILP